MQNMVPSLEECLQVMSQNRKPPPSRIGSEFPGGHAAAGQIVLQDRMNLFTATATLIVPANQLHTIFFTVCYDRKNLVLRPVHLHDQKR